MTLSAAISVSRTSSAVVAASSRASQTPPGASASLRPVAIATAVLPIPPGPTISTSRSSSEQLGERGDLGLAPDQLGRQRRQVPGRAAARERRVLVEDLLLELLQPRPGLEAELVGQPGPDALVGRQRVGLAPRAVERGDQQLPQPSWYGYVATAASSSPITSPPRAATAAASRVSTSCMRASSSRARWGAAQSPVAGSTSPR